MTIEVIIQKGNENDRKIGGIGNTGAGIAWADYDNDGDLISIGNVPILISMAHSLETMVTVLLLM